MDFLELKNTDTRVFGGSDVVKGRDIDRTMSVIYQVISIMACQHIPTLIKWKGVAGILHKVVSQVLVIPL